MNNSEVTMSNNKQTDIAELAIKEYPFSNSERNAFIAGYNKSKGMHEEQEIELPSHYEIWDEAHKEESSERHYAFMRGAKWMRNKIQGGNNEQR